MTAYKHLSNDELLDQVERAGRILPAELIQALLARRIELRSAILARFAESLNDNWENDDDPRWYRAVHYGFLLIAYRERKALPIFAAIYSDPDLYEGLLEWFEETPAHFGPPAAPVFQAVIQDAPGMAWHFGAAMSVAILKNIAIRFPETRENILTFLRSLLPPLNADGRVELNDDAEIDELWGSVVDALAELRDRESTPQILAMFDAELIDPMETDRESYLDVLEGVPAIRKSQPFDIFAEYASRDHSNTAQSA